MPRPLARLVLPVAALLLAAAAPAFAALPSSPSYAIESNRQSLKLGLSVSTAGDVNGDGFSDLIVSSDGSVTGNASFYLYLGRAVGSPFAPSQLAYQKLNASVGVMASAAGDVNGDGRDDIAVAWGTLMRVYFGSATGIDTSSYFQYVWPGLTPALYYIKVAPAGDVNGDGYDDVLLSHPESNGFGACAGQFNGSVLVFYGSASGLSASSVTQLCGGAASSYFGIEAHGAGDVNGDGRDDIIVGAPGAGTTGQARIFLGAPGGINTFASTTLSGDQNGMSFGGSVGPAGDVNGDGYADVIVGAPNRDYSPGSTVDAGAAYVYLGGSGGVSTSVHWSEWGAGANARFGSAVRTAGDVDGDGYAEIAVGSPTYSNGQSSEGQFAIFYGSSLGVVPTSYFPESNVESAYFGSSLSSAGDVNGDGFGDVIVGAPYWSNGQTFEGSAFLYLGSADAPNPNAPAATWFGSQASSRLGWSVGSGGDFNRDGIADVIVGEVGYNDGSANGGRIHLFLGGLSGLPATPSASYSVGGGSGNLGIAVTTVGDVGGDGIDDIVAGAHVYAGVGVAILFNGNTAGQLNQGAVFTGSSQTDEYFGAAISSRGDLNGDGYADVVIGAPGWDGPLGADQGRVYIFFGRAGGIIGFPSADVIIEGTQAGERFGTSVALIADIDRDGAGDLVVGAPGYDSPAGQFFIVDTGRYQIYRGLRSAPWVTPYYSGAGGSQANLGASVTDAGDLDGDGYSDVAIGGPFTSNAGSVVIVYGGPGSPKATGGLTSPQNFSGFGASVSGCGDINADGYTDLLVGATFHDVTLQDEGQISVFLGGPNGLAITPFWTKPGGQAFANIGHVVAGVGDVNGDGFPDVAGGAPGYDLGSADRGYVQVFLANGGGRPRMSYARGTSGGPRIPHLGLAGSNSGFEVWNLVSSAAGRSRGWYEWRLERTAFGSYLPLSFLYPAAALDTYIAPYGFTAQWPQGFGGLDGGVPYAWYGRSRAREPYFPTTPWVQPGLNGRHVYDLRTNPNPLDAPIASADLRLDLAAPVPNPSRASAALTFSLARSGEVSLGVHDLQGRLVRALVSGSRGAGTYREVWDGRDEAGRATRSGIYFVRLVTPEGTRETRLVRLD